MWLLWKIKSPNCYEQKKVDSSIRTVESRQCTVGNIQAIVKSQIRKTILKLLMQNARKFVPKDLKENLAQKLFMSIMGYNCSINIQAIDLV